MLLGHSLRSRWGWYSAGSFPPTRPGMPPLKVALILSSASSGIAPPPQLTASPGSAVLQHLCASRAAFASLKGKPFPSSHSPQCGQSIGRLLISVELLIMLAFFLCLSGDFRAPAHRVLVCAIGESLALRPPHARHLHQDRRHRSDPEIAFRETKEDDAPTQASSRLRRRQRRDLRSAHRLRIGDLWRHGVALISFACGHPTRRTAARRGSPPPMQIQLLVWLFAMRIISHSSALSYC